MQSNSPQRIDHEVVKAIALEDPEVKAEYNALEGEVILNSRNTRYTSDMCQKIIDIAEQGGHVPAMLKAIGVRSKDTFYRWLKEYPEFNEAYEASKLASQAFYEEVLLAGALGKIKNYNFNSMAMILNNKFGEEYKRNATGSSTEVNIGAINNLEVMDTPARRAKIQQIIEKLDLIPQKDDDAEFGSSTS
jgi:hypothetical protein